MSDRSDQSMWEAIKELQQTVESTFEKLKPLLDLQVTIQKVVNNWKGIVTFIVALVTVAYLVGKYEGEYKNDPQLAAAVHEQSKEIHELMIAVKERKRPV